MGNCERAGHSTSNYSTCSVITVIRDQKWTHYCVCCVAINELHAAFLGFWATVTSQILRTGPWLLSGDCSTILVLSSLSLHLRLVCSWEWTTALPKSHFWNSCKICRKSGSPFQGMVSILVLTHFLRSTTSVKHTKSHSLSLLVQRRFCTFCTCLFQLFLFIL